MSIDRPTFNKPVMNKDNKTQSVNAKYNTKENDVNPFLNEVDVFLNEKEMSLKKKIFSLPKMEGLVHGHPRLSEIYREMAANGEERYGYHYNETIMNIIFNDYVLNDSELLQLYKITRPKEKKRRDRSGIRQLQKELGGDDDKPKKKSDDKPKKEKKVEEGGVSIEGLPTKDQKPAIHGGKIMDTGAGEGLSSEDKKLKKTDIKIVDTVTKPAKDKVDNKTYKIGVEETTNTGSVGGSAFGSGGYATPHAWSSQGDLMGGSKKDKRGKVLRKALRENKNYLIDGSAFEEFYNELNESFNSNIPDLMNEFISKYVRENSDSIEYINKNSDAYGNLENMNQEDINIIKKDIETGHLDEKAQSKAQQRFMGMVRGVQKGDIPSNKVGKNVLKTAATMKRSDVKDFASTSHDDLPERVNEHHKHTPEEQAEFIAKHVSPTSKYRDYNYMLKYIHPTDIKKIYDKIERNMGLSIEKNNINENHINLDDPNELAKFIIIGNSVYLGKKLPDAGIIRILTRTFASKGLDYLRDAYNTTERQLGNDGVEEVKSIMSTMNETESSMISDNNQSMAFKPQAEGNQGSIPMGMSELRESEGDEIPNPAQDVANAEHETAWDKMYDSDEWVQAQRDVEGYDDKLFEELNEELKAFSVHHNKLKTMTEDRRPSALVLKDRLGKDNESNFKSDMKNSATKDVVKMEKDMAWKEQQEEIGKNPYKKGEDLEKQSLKVTKGVTLKNVGNSANAKGDEVPKRNLTDDEQNEVDMYRLGQQDLVYDNKPDERFEERMKADMGDKMYDQRQKKLEFRGKAPMYNKDSQPIHDTTSDKVQFNKEQSGWNERKGLGEGHVTGRFTDVLGKRRLIDFELDETKLISKDKLNENFFKLDFTGLGNAYDSKGNINESVNNSLKSHTFYTNGKVVVVVQNTKKSLNENNQKQKQVVNEEFNKMKHLLGYNPKNFVNTKNNKL